MVHQCRLVGPPGWLFVDLIGCPVCHRIPLHPSVPSSHSPLWLSVQRCLSYSDLTPTFPDSHAIFGLTRVMTINIISPLILTKGLLPLVEMFATHGDPAPLINIDSIGGLHANFLPTFSYGPGRAGNHHLTRTLAARLARRHISVNAIAPPGRFQAR